MHEPEQLFYQSTVGTPLHAAITGKDPLKAVSFLLSLETKIANIADLSQVTPLFLAVYTGNIEVVLVLL